jgi:hypothetical protein
MFEDNLKPFNETGLILAIPKNFEQIMPYNDGTAKGSQVFTAVKNSFEENPSYLGVLLKFYSEIIKLNAPDIPPLFEIPSDKFNPIIQPLLLLLVDSFQGVNGDMLNLSSPPLNELCIMLARASSKINSCMILVCSLHLLIIVLTFCIISGC